MDYGDDELFSPEGKQPVPPDHQADPDSANPQKSGCGLKFLLMTMAIAGGLSLLCCCGIGISLYSMAPQIEENPAIAKQNLSTLLTIDLPDGYEPQGSIKMNIFSFVSMDGVFIENREDNGIIVVMGFTGTLANDKNIIENIRESAEFGNAESDIDEQAREVHEVNINGEVVKFDFVKGTVKESNKEVRQIHAIINGHEGPILFMMSVSEEAWDEQQALKMIASINIPAI